MALSTARRAALLWFVGAACLLVAALFGRVAHASDLVDGIAFGGAVGMGLLGGRAVFMA